MSFDPEEVFKGFQQAIQLKHPLDKLEVLIVKCVLQKAIEKLLIIKELLRGPEKTQPFVSGYKSPAIRMKEREKFVPPEAKLPDNVLVPQQIKWQISFILDLFQETLMELEFQGSDVYLEYTLVCENLKLLDNCMIKNGNKDYNTLINYLQEKLRYKKKSYYRTQQILLDSTGPCLDKALVNVYAEERLGALYACDVAKTRIERNVLKCKENEGAVKQFNEMLDHEVEEENLTHQEVNSQLTLLLTHLINKVEFWTHKYNTEIDQLDVNLLQMKSQKDEQSTALETLQNQVADKKEIMEALQAEQNAREKEMEKKLLENKAAAKIQRWWKNILFKRSIFNKIFRRKFNRLSNKPTNKKKTKKIK